MPGIRTVSPKIELSDERAERVDVRVLPMIFRFDKPRGMNLYPGQLVDVYIGGDAFRPESAVLSAKTAPAESFRAC